MTERDLTTQGRILRALCYSGQYPMSKYTLLVDDETNERAIYKMILAMRDRGQLIIRWAGGYEKKIVRDYRKAGAEKVILPCWRKGSKKGQPIVEQMIIDEIGQEYLELVKEHPYTSQATQMQRRNRTAEVAQIMVRSGIEVIAQPFLGEEGWSTHDKGYYYASTNVKRSKHISEKSVIRSRYTGLLLSPGGAYTIYNIRFNNMYLSGKQENATRIEMDTAVLRQSNLNQGPKYSRPHSMIMYGHTDGKILERLIYDNKGPYHELYSGYTAVHYIRVDDDAVHTTWLLTQPYWRERMNNVLFNKKYHTNLYLSHDAYVPDDRQYLLNWCDADIKRLRSAKNLLNNKTSGELFVVCFPWQVDIVHDYLGQDRVKIRNIFPEQAKNILQAFEEGGG